MQILSEEKEVCVSEVISEPYGEIKWEHQNSQNVN